MSNACCAEYQGRVAFISTSSRFSSTILIVCGYTEQGRIGLPAVNVLQAYGTQEYRYGDGQVSQSTRGRRRTWLTQAAQ